MAIQNQSLYTHVDFLPVDEFQLIGEYADKKLLLVGRSRAYGDPIVAISETEAPDQEDLSAYDLYELMKFGSHPVKLTAAIVS